MASLQTIRNKGGIIVAIIIGLALAAFVLGDLFTSGSTLFGDSQNRVGEIDGKKISYQEFATNYERLSELYKITTGGSASQVEEAMIRDQAWELLVDKYAIQPSLEKLGITVSDDEMLDLVSGKNPSPLIVQSPLFANPETGMFDPAKVGEFIQQIPLDTQGALQLFWSNLQNSIHDMTLRMKYETLISQGGYVTNFEAEQMAKLEGNSFNVEFVAKPYSAIVDSTITVSDKEIKDYYNAYPRLFETPTARTIEYISYIALPTESDYKAAEEYINGLYEEFIEAKDVLQFASLNSQTPIDSRYYAEGELYGELGEFAFNSTKEDTYGPVLEGEQYTLARIADKRMVPDSVDFSIIYLNPTNKELADSLHTALKSGGDFEEAAVQHSLDPSTVTTKGHVGTFDPQTLDESLSKELIKAKQGDIVRIDSFQGIALVKVNSTKGSNEKVQLATIKYTIEPSETTRNDYFSKANMFALQASEKGFDAAVNENSLIKRTSTLTTRDRNVSGLENSRELVRWAFNSKVDEISKVESFGDTYVVAVLKSSVEEGIAPLTNEMKYEIKSQLIKNKKGELIAAEMKGANSVADLAAKMGVEPQTAESVSVTTYIVPEVGRDIAFAGGVAGIGQASISKPIVGEMAVYVARILENSGNPIDTDIVKSRIRAENQQRSQSTSYEAVLKLSDIKDMRYKFF